ncbi:hypothetical protein Z517_06874 [Fonsecaea pedrosoi CBS 271.37]|uniref:RING-type domain-containing protein n=1 Tax=Fonsecaea pedrosoi CBS 271.37 TaxID=1442368 RepID=A0A0D2H6F7_9EURO|nr:uncharacterized protein Z517_06874 [Fonsecaea pedrosoi CBS 271.37]KIW80259.1 hypothetical protein Z517_06874 [Fonsecaea pedrosoi CBS 271.37]
MSNSSGGGIAFRSHTYTHKYLQPSREWSEALEAGKAVARRGKPTSLQTDQAPEETQTWLTRLDQHMAETQTATRYSSVRAQSSYRGRRPSEGQVTSSTRRTISSEPSIRDSDLSGDSDYHFHRMQQETIRMLEVLLARLEDRTRSLPPVTAAADVSGAGQSSTRGRVFDPAPAVSSASIRATRRRQSRSNAPSIASSRSSSPTGAYIPSTTSSRSSSRSSSASRNSNTSSSSISSETECGICLNALSSRNRDDDDDDDDDDNETWRCSTCHNATHAMCFDEWMARSTTNSVICIYCRAPVSSST